MHNSPINLFEFVKYPINNIDGEGLRLSEKEISELENVLNLIWKERNKFTPSENLYYKSESKKQRLIDIGRHEIASRNWIGTIHFRSNEKDFVLNLLPKIFHKENHKYSKDELNSIFAHILWWLSGSEKQNYSSMASSLEAMESDLLEVMAYMFSSHALEIFSVSAYHYYHTVEEELETVRGQIDFNSYVNNYSRGNKHIIPCVFDSFQYDNQFNRIVKFVSSLLKDFTKNASTKKNLEELLFILDEVDNATVTVEDCDRVILNPIYTEFQTILDNCRLFLSSLSVYKWKDDYSVFALLIPAEKLFENFIYSTLKDNAWSNIKTVSRTKPGRSNLVRQMPGGTERYSMLNDIVVKLQDKTHILFDCKYKKVYNKNNDTDEELDPVYNISQSDIYQMVSYAVGSGIDKIGLIYPKSISESKNEELPIYEIDDELSDNKTICIHPFKVDIMHEDRLQINTKGKLENLFAEAKIRLVKQLNEAIINIKT